VGQGIVHRDRFYGCFVYLALLIVVPAGRKMPNVGGTLIWQAATRSLLLWRIVDGS